MSEIFKILNDYEITQNKAQKDYLFMKMLSRIAIALERIGHALDRMEVNK